MKYLYIRIITSVCLFALCMITLLTFQEHVLFYQEQHSLFLYTGEYFNHMLKVKGLPDYLGAFVIQFYHIPALGAAIVSGLLVAVYLLTESIIRRLTGRHDLLQLGVAVSIALYFTLDNIDETPRTLMLALMILLGVWILALIFGRWLPARTPDSKLPLWKTILSLAFAAIYLTAGYSWMTKNYDRRERAMLLISKDVADKNWDGAIKRADAYLSTGNPNKLVLYLRNLSLAHKGELIDHLFDYPMPFGADALVFPWNGKSIDAEYGHLVREAVGDLNGAHCWAFESMAIWGETAPHVTNLARYNIAIGRPLAAQKFVNILSKTLFYRNEARKLQRQIDGEEPGDIHYAFGNREETTTRFIDMTVAVNDIMEIVKTDPENDMARQYLVALLLAYNDLDGLMKYLSRNPIKSHVIEEAMFSYTTYPDSQPLDSLGLKLAEDTRDRAKRLTELINSHNRAGATREFGRTFWNYLYNISPYGKTKNNTLEAQRNNAGGIVE